MRTTVLAPGVLLLAFAQIAILVAPSISAEELPPPSVDTTIARGLEFLATQQNLDGSFGATQKPTNTGLALMSFLACGHTPNAGKFDANVGKFGSNVRLAIDYLLAQAQPDGSFGRQDKLMPGQAITTLALAEAYGVDDSEPQRKRIAAALAASVKLIVTSQEARKADANSGIRKTDANPADGDLAHCEWTLAALRACQDVGITVPKQIFQRAGKFVLKCYNAREKGFSQQPGLSVEPGANAAGLLCLRLLDAAQRPDFESDAARTLAADPVDDSSTKDSYSDIYFATQGAFQVGDATWHAVVKVTFDKLAKSQQADGGWPESGDELAAAGRGYSTSMALLALSVPYRLLPVAQR